LNTRPIAVVGLGYVGLPLAVGYAEAGYASIGFDVDDGRVAHLNLGRSHIEDIDDVRLGACIEAKRFRATTDAAELATADVVFVCVPTPFDRAKTPDLSFVRAATLTVANALREGMLVILQSTTYPGTTTEILLPALEASGLKAGVDFFLAFSPERVDPGNATWTVRNTPKVVGGVNPESTRRASAVLRAVMGGEGLVTEVSSPAAAEMTKLLENTYRAVNIALVNELTQLAHEMDLDMWEVIDAASTKPFGFQAFRPGVGPGGHCIPVDPYYLAWKAREFDFQTKFIELAADTNLGMASYVATRVQQFMNRLGRNLNGARVLGLGVSFKAGVSDTRNSRAVRVLELLEQAGAVVEYADPNVVVAEIGGHRRASLDLAGLDVTRFDLVAVLVADAGWPIDHIVSADVPLFDTVNATHGRQGPNVERL
jgi:UDP-N-acetyl-D-glucosamine dehydrogenase